MYIKEIILDGFKSYAQRTVVSGFDRQFNSITGLNGTGKSNILDAICFVLGLNSLTLIRATTPQELIYKLGHGGITKATVSIVLDNTDKNFGPAGLDDYDTVIITRIIQHGKTKYYMNGKSVTNGRIKNLFKSIQLNIDNPHFLVSQGRITKLTSHKPHELLSLLEETAGTSMYEQKRKECFKTIEKKENKLIAVEEILKQDIQPKMQSLKKEQDAYFKWKAGEIELDRLEKLLIAGEFYAQKKTIEALIMDLNNTEFAKSEMIAKIKSNEEKTKAALNEIEDGELKLSGESYLRFKHLKQEVKAKRLEISTLESEVRNLEKAMKDSQKERETIEAVISELNQHMQRFEYKMELLEKSIERVNQLHEEKKEAYEKNQSQLESFLRGDKSLEDEVNTRLTQAEISLANLSSLINKTEANRKHLFDEAEKIRTSLETKEAIALTEQEIKDLNSEVEKMRIEIDKKEFDTREEDYQDLQEKLKTYQTGVYQLHIKLNNMISNNPAFKISYKCPEIPRNRVKGRVFQLFSIADPAFLKAMEAIGGARLFHIVVDDEEVSKTLIKNRAFGNIHVVLIPNSKILSSPIHPDNVTRARRIAHDMFGQAVPASSLIKFDPELRPTMEYIFGSTFVCSTTEIAKRIAFDPKIRTRCVNLEGDIFDPAGTLTGGYHHAKGSILTVYSEYKKLLEEHEEKMIVQRNMEEQVAALRVRVDDYSKLKHNFEIKSHKLALLEKKVKEEKSEKTKEKVEMLELQAQDLEEHINSLNEEHKEREKEVAALRKEKEAVEGGKKDLKDMVNEQVSKMKKEMERVSNELKKLKKEKTYIEVDIENTKEEIRRKKMALTEEQGHWRKNRKSYEKGMKELELVREFHAKIDEEKRDLDKIFSVVEVQMSRGEAELEKLDKSTAAIERELHKIQANITKLNKEIKSNEKKLEKMEERAPWVGSIQDELGAPGGKYDFDVMDMEAERQKYEKIKKQQDYLYKRVNPKIEAICEKIHKEYNSLIERRKTLSLDKIQLKKSIDELDRKRKESLAECFIKVNKYFGEIFSTLLPGACSELNLVDPRDMDRGIEIKVGFSNVWKKSLAELSGGQRSLVALSFLLGMLKYKPAPFYIFDEIDAALDLSHTDNIGAMISRHFSHSQFIIISLKEELYSKANVLFRTQCSHGVSSVDRVENPDAFLKKSYERSKRELEEAGRNDSDSRSEDSRDDDGSDGKMDQEKIQATLPVDNQHDFSSTLLLDNE